MVTCVFKHCLGAMQDRDPLAPLQDPPTDDIRQMLEGAIMDLSSAQVSDPENANLLEAQ